MVTALSYKNQSILLHSFSANILKQYFQIINIWSSPNNIMYKIIINTFILFNLINTNKEFKDIDENQSQLDLQREYNELSPDMIAESTNYKKELEINFSKIPEVLDKHAEYFFIIRWLLAKLYKEKKLLLAKLYKEKKLLLAKLYKEKKLLLAKL
jgi:hypothetical protein